MIPYYDEDGIAIFHGDARDVWPVEPSSVACVVFSPPYNAGIDYDDHDDVMPWPEYEALATAVCEQSHRALMAGGRAWVNVTPVVPTVPIPAGDHSGRGVNPRVSLLGLWTRTIEAAGLGIWDYIAWATPRGPSCAWGSWESPSGPNMRGEWETIIAAHRGPWARPHGAEFHGWKDKVGRWIDLTTNVWKMHPEPRTENGHPAPFPDALPTRCIRLSAFPGELVVDPFMGSGSTLFAARSLGRRAVGVERSERYCELAATRLSQGAFDFGGAA